MKSVMQHPVVFLDSYLDNDLCDFIIQEGKKLKIEEAAVYEKNTSRKVEDNSIRKANTAFFERGHWVESIISSILHAVNQTAWQTVITNTENIQFGVYGQGQYYGAHRDVDLATPINRKLSITVQLTNPNYYKGGDFVLWSLSGKELRNDEWRNKGSILVFPSFLKHEVEPVTKGTRMSLVQWYAGPEWK